MLLTQQSGSSGQITNKPLKSTFIQKALRIVSTYSTVCKLKKTTNLNASIFFLSWDSSLINVSDTTNKCKITGALTNTLGDLWSDQNQIIFTQLKIQTRDTVSIS